MSKLCTLPNGRKINKGDKVKYLGKTVTAKGTFTDDGDKYLTFEEGGEAMVKAGAPFWRTYSGGAHIHVHVIK